MKGVSNLVHKESDRLAEVMKLLGEFKRTANVDGDALIIKGNKHILTTPMDLILPDDHRMVMTAGMFLRLHAGEAYRLSKPLINPIPASLISFRIKISLLEKWCRCNHNSYCPLPLVDHRKFP